MKADCIWNKKICVLLALILLFAGICFESFETYSFFEYVENGNTYDTYILQSASDKNYGLKASKVFFTAENESVYEVSSIRNASVIVETAAKSIRKLCIKAAIILTLLTVLSTIIKKQKRMADDYFISSRSLWDSLIRFIHLKDGEKA